jgi:acetoin utilization protein AcuB
MLIPTVNRYMTANPYTVDPADPMSVAHDLMREYGFHHVPVVHDGKLVGIVSDRDLHLLEALRYESTDQVTVAEAMRRAVSTVAPDAPLDEAIDRMSRERCDALAVVGKTGVIGIFTATDALWALTDLLRREAAYAS